MVKRIFYFNCRFAFSNTLGTHKEGTQIKTIFEAPQKNVKVAGRGHNYTELSAKSEKPLC